MVTEELVERPKEEVLPVIFDIIDNIQDYPLDKAIESLDIKCLEQDTEENKKDSTRSLKTKHLSQSRFCVSIAGEGIGINIAGDIIEFENIKYLVLAMIDY